METKNQNKSLQRAETLCTAEASAGDGGKKQLLTAAALNH